MHYYQCFNWEQVHLWDLVSDEKMNIDSHVHREFEASYMIDGEAEYVIEGNKFHLTSDSLLIIPSNLFHQWKFVPYKNRRHKSLHFPPEMLDKTEQKTLKEMFKAPLLFSNRQRINFASFFKMLNDCKKLPENLQKISVKTLVFSLLVQSHLLSLKEAEKPLVIDERIQKVAAYINDNLEKEITVEKLAYKFAVTKNYLSTLFYKVMGVHLKKYITIKRLEFACQFIFNGSNLGEAAYKAGFGDYSTFFRAYKSVYNRTPSNLTIAPEDYIHNIIKGTGDPPTILIKL